MTQKILLVKDDNTTADFIVKGLSEQGFAVDHANNGRDGLFHATDGTYDAIVLDRMLPGMDGMAVLGAIRAAGITTPVIILSALGAVEDRVAGLRGRIYSRCQSLKPASGPTDRHYPCTPETFRTRYPDWPSRRFA